MFCMNCGNQLNEGAIFCPKCGFKCDRSETAIRSENISTQKIPENGISGEDRMSKRDFLALPEMKELKDKINKNLIFSYVFGGLGCLGALLAGWIPLFLISLIVLLLTVTLVRTKMAYKTTLCVMIASIFGLTSLFLTIELIYLLKNIKILDNYYNKYLQTGSVVQVHLSKSLGEI